ncbi:MAG: exodeoxyribonuclease VII small subunit [Oscillospiraceae bacterium]|nr:exodeoxyribonuclease VII small subunit [Oscillospiraceae bacterium]
MAVKFEEALEGLENTVANLKKESLSLDEAMKNYELGMKYYKQCEELLNQAKQKIEYLSSKGDSIEGI